MTTKIIIDDTYGYENACRYYKDFSPTLRSERFGLKVLCKYTATITGVKRIEMENNKYRIRKLTPKECWRLQGFSDKHFERAKLALNQTFYNGKDKSNSQLYKQAGNSIVTDVLFHIFCELYIAMPYLFDDLKVSSYFSGIGAFEVALDRLFSSINDGTVITHNE